MIRQVVLAAAATSFLCAAGIGQAADFKARPGVAAAPPLVLPIEDCSVFYDDYRRRGFTWGSGPGTGVGFGVFEGALPRYPDNQFPNWYGLCDTWGHYSAAGSARN